MKTVHYTTPYTVSDLESLLADWRERLPDHPWGRPVVEAIDGHHPGDRVSVRLENRVRVYLFESMMNARLPLRLPQNGGTPA